MNFRFPVFLDLTAKKCLVTGEGYEVAGKVQALVDASAEVVYVNPKAEAAIEAMAAAGLIRWEKREFLPADLDSLFLVISDLEDNSEIFRLAEERRILCNCVDDPEHCRFSFGSIHRRGELTIAISTNGWAPAVAVRLKERFQREIGPEYKDFLDLLKGVRPEITARIGDGSASGVVVSDRGFGGVGHAGTGREEPGGKGCPGDDRRSYEEALGINRRAIIKAPRLEGDQLVTILGSIPIDATKGNRKVLLSHFRNRLPLHCTHAPCRPHEPPGD